MAKKTNEWQERRSKFNHDWLKNKYLNNLDAFIAVQQNSTSPILMLKEYLDEDFEQWGKNQEEGKWLIDTFEEAMSPVILFDELPLRRMKAEDKKWAKELIHSNWLARHEVKEKIIRARECLNKANKEYSAIKEQLHKLNITTSGLKSILPEFKSFRNSCMAFSKSISNLPKTIH